MTLEHNHGQNQRPQSHRYSCGQPNAYAAHGARYEPGETCNAPGTNASAGAEVREGREPKGVQSASTRGCAGVAAAFFFEGAGKRPYQPDGSAPSPAYIDDFVATEEGLRLAKAFMRLRPAFRRRIVDLVNEVAGESGSSSAALSYECVRFRFRAGVAGRVDVLIAAPPGRHPPSPNSTARRSLLAYPLKSIGWHLDQNVRAVAQAD
jgi:hypothetical protein